MRAITQSVKSTQAIFWKLHKENTFCVIPATRFRAEHRKRPFRHFRAVFYQSRNRLNSGFLDTRQRSDKSARHLSHRLRSDVR